MDELQRWIEEDRAEADPAWQAELKRLHRFVTGIEQICRSETETGKPYSEVK